MIEARNLDVERNGRLLAQLGCLKAKAGDVIGVIGRSGCGKTTLLEALAGIRSAGPAAKFEVDGAEVESFREIAVRTIQSFPLFHWLRAADIIALAETARSGARTHPLPALGLMGAQHLADRYPHEMSGGERARVTLAIAWSLRTRILLLDEPFNGLDPISKRSLIEDILGNFREFGTIVFIVSHALEDIVSFSTRCLAFTPHGLREIRAINAPALIEAIS